MYLRAPEPTWVVGEPLLSPSPVPLTCPWSKSPRGQRTETGTTLWPLRTEWESAGDELAPALDDATQPRRKDVTEQVAAGAGCWHDGEAQCDPPALPTARAFPSLGGLGRFARGRLQLCRMPWPWAPLFSALGESAWAVGQPVRCSASSEWPWGVSHPHFRAPRSMKSCWKMYLRQSEDEGGAPFSRSHRIPSLVGAPHVPPTPRLTASPLPDHRPCPQS